MFFDKEWVGDNSLKKAWLASHGHYNTEDGENVDYGNLTSKILEKVNESKSRRQARLSLRTSSALVNGVARLYMADTEKLLHDCASLDEALKNRNRKPSSSEIGNNTSMEDDSYCASLEEALKNRNCKPSSSNMGNKEDSCNTNSSNSTKEASSSVPNTSNVATREVAVQTDRSYLSKMAGLNSMCYIQVHDSNGLLKRIICCPANSHVLDTHVNN
ncbi:uncharacterized protein LOC123700591 [Colias croceus]|uniref:uncharacterized protein LOC123700591 n=1 Tax=Colias crocea TaxID=72248 RepID=UPI001E281475|nr:uncharacterized protein LOC123700591 [Colias croceus]